MGPAPSSWVHELFKSVCRSHNVSHVTFQNLTQHGANKYCHHRLGGVFGEDKGGQLAGWLGWPGGAVGEGERGELVGMVEQPQGQRQGGCKGLSGGHSC